MGHVYLVRSGNTDYDDQERIVGNLDIPMNTRGVAEVDELEQELKDRDICMIYGSNTEASRQTAEMLGEKLSVRVKILEQLTNLDFGLWQGMSFEEVKVKHKKQFRQWQDHPDENSPPAGEATLEVVERVKKALKKVIKKSQTSNLVIVAPEPLRSIIRCILSGSIPSELTPWDRQLVKEIETVA